MIRVHVLYHNDIIESISINGHANYDYAGKDIVCAAVSTMAITTINNILTLDNKAITYDTNEGNLSITVNSDNEVADKLLNNMLNMLKELELDYPKNIKIGGLKWNF